MSTSYLMHKSLPNYVSYVSRVLRALVPRALRAVVSDVHYALSALMPRLPCALHALVPHVRHTVSALMSDMPCALHAIKPHSLSCLTSPTC